MNPHRLSTQDAPREKPQNVPRDSTTIYFPEGDMTTETLCEFLDAAHLSKFVHSTFTNRGGILIVAPPGSLKTSVMEYVFDYYPNAFVLSNVNQQSLDKFREDMISNRYYTMAFPEYQMLYARDSRTAAGVEQTIAMLVEEGWRKPSFADPRAGGLKSRMLVVGGMPPNFYENHFDGWQKSGFIRRFIICMFSVDNPDMITEAIKGNRKLGLSGIERKPVGANGIPFNIDNIEANFLHRLVKEQPDDKTPLILLMRIYAVFKWKHGTSRAKAIMNDLAPSFKRDGGVLTLTEV